MSTTMTLRGPLSAGDIAQLCATVDALLAQGQPVLLTLEHCDLTVVDAVSRLRLLAHRHHGLLELTGDRTMLAWCGLDP